MVSMFVNKQQVQPCSGGFQWRDDNITFHDISFADEICGLHDWEFDFGILGYDII
jgi:hypothetical protein